MPPGLLQVTNALAKLEGRLGVVEAQLGAKQGELGEVQKKDSTWAQEAQEKMVGGRVCVWGGSEEGCLRVQCILVFTYSILVLVTYGFNVF